MSKYEGISCATCGAYNEGRGACVMGPPGAINHDTGNGWWPLVEAEDFCLQWVDVATVREEFGDRRQHPHEGPKVVTLGGDEPA